MTTRAGREREKREHPELAPDAGDPGAPQPKAPAADPAGNGQGPLGQPKGFPMPGDPQPCDRHVRVAVFRITAWVGRITQAPQILDEHRDELVRILRDFAATCFVEGGVDAITKTSRPDRLEDDGDAA